MEGVLLCNAEGVFVLSVEAGEVSARDFGLIHWPYPECDLDVFAFIVDLIGVDLIGGVIDFVFGLGHVVLFLVGGDFCFFEGFGFVL